jgi:hypothetical protein
MCAYERSWQAGNHLALLDAVNSCRDFNATPPPWLAEALTKIITEKEGGAVTTNYIHFWRWDTVKASESVEKSLPG